MQPGGHRFDPGQLHRKSVVSPSPVKVPRVETHGDQGIMDGKSGWADCCFLLWPLIVGGVIGAMGMIHRHQERLAKIERGIDPDGPWPQQRQ